jgi:hypothetical protein
LAALAYSRRARNVHLYGLCITKLDAGCLTQQSNALNDLTTANKLYDATALSVRECRQLK